ncbi:hypothetical protein ABPG72_019842 [Tetrahymena utriculariae]
MKWIWLLLVLRVVFCRFLDVDINQSTIIQNNVMSCVQRQCIYQDDDLINICQGFDHCANTTCESQLQIDNFKNYQKCNQECLNPVIQGLSESDKEVVTGYYNCRIECTKQVIQNFQNSQNQDQNNNDEMKIEAIFVSISIFIALALGVAMYIWCSIYHRRRQEVIIIPGQIHPSQEQNPAQNADHQEVLQSRITDPDKIFVVEGSAILHQNQQIVPKFGLSIPQGLVIGTQLNQQGNSSDQSQSVSLQIVDTTLIELNQLSVYNNLSIVDNGNDFNTNLINSSFVNSSSIGNLENNESQVQQREQANDNQQSNGIQDLQRVVASISNETNNNNNNNDNNNSNNHNLRSNQTSNNVEASMQNQNIERYPFVITNHSPFVVADRSSYLPKSNKIIPIHDVQITPIIHSKKPNAESENKHNSLESNSKNKNVSNILDELDLESNIKSLAEKDSAIQNEKIKPKNLLGAEFIKRSSKSSSKRHSHRNSILANLENRAIQNKRKSTQYTDSTEAKPEEKEQNGSGEQSDESDYEYYYETESSGDSSDEQSEGKNQNQNEDKNKRRSKDILKDQITLQIPGCQDELHLSEEEKPVEKKEANNISQGSNNKCNGSTEETIMQICSTSQNFGQSGFTVRCYSPEKNKELPNMTDRFNESQKIMIVKGSKQQSDNKNNINEINLSCTESPSNQFSQSQTLSPQINHQIKQSPQKLILKACCTNINVTQQETRKKSSSLDLNPQSPKDKQNQLNEAI